MDEELAKMTKYGVWKVVDKEAWMISLQANGYTPRKATRGSLDGSREVFNNEMLTSTSSSLRWSIKTLSGPCSPFSIMSISKSIWSTSSQHFSTKTSNQTTTSSVTLLKAIRETLSRYSNSTNPCTAHNKHLGISTRKLTLDPNQSVLSPPKPIPVCIFESRGRTRSSS